jgi:hypothetical protein
VPKSIPSTSVAAILIFIGLVELMELTSLNGQALSAGESPGKCFKLKQFSSISGDVEITINAKCLKLLFKKSNNLVFAKAPDWMAYKYNLGTKKYCIIPAGKFTNNVSMPRGMMNVTTFSDVALQKNGPSQYKKFTKMVYSTGPDHYSKALKLYRARDVTGDYPASMSVAGLLTENCAKEEIKLLDRINALPGIAEIPLEASSTGLDRNSHVYLTTLSLEEIPVTASTFAEPTNFKKVASESKLNEDNEFNENFLDFMNSDPKKR